MRPLVVALVALLLACGLLLPFQPARAGEARTTAAPADAARATSLAAALRTRRLTNVKFTAAPLEDVLAWLRTATGFNYVVDRKALAKAGVDVEDVTFSVELEDVTPATLLALLLEPHDLALVVKGNVATITTRAASLGKPVTRLYAIAHITYTKVDFIAPDINLDPSGFTPPEEYEPERIVEDDPLSTGEAVLDLVKDLVARDLWDSEGWSIRATDRYLVVRAPPSVQADVSRALDLIASLK